MFTQGQSSTSEGQLWVFYLGKLRTGRKTHEIRRPQTSYLEHLTNSDHKNQNAGKYQIKERWR